MPTARPRHTLTETDEVAAALATAAKHWREDQDRPTRLIIHLMKAGELALADEEAVRVAERLRAIRETRGVFDDPHMASHLGALRDEWPA